MRRPFLVAAHAAAGQRKRVVATLPNKHIHEHRHSGSQENKVERDADSDPVHRGKIGQYRRNRYCPKGHCSSGQLVSNLGSSLDSHVPRRAHPVHGVPTASVSPKGPGPFTFTDVQTGPACPRIDDAASEEVRYRSELFKQAVGVNP